MATFSKLRWRQRCRRESLADKAVLAVRMGPLIAALIRLSKPWRWRGT